MIDIEKLKNFLGSDEGFIAVLMDKFLQEIPKDKESLLQVAKDEDWPRVRAVSHKMLSSTKIFGFEELTAVLQKVEKYSETKTNLDQMPALIDSFSELTEKAISETKEVRKTLK